MPLPVDTEIYLRRTLGGDFGTPSGESNFHYQQDSFTGDGVTTVFNLSHSPGISILPSVYQAGILQLSPENYGLVGQILTFAVPPGNLVPVLVVYEY